MSARARLFCGVSVVLVIHSVFGIPQKSHDPCDPQNHKVRDEPHRSVAYTYGSEAPSCDNHLEAGWYRFTSGAGGKMPEKCPPLRSCGTLVPIWMNGTHPSVDDGVTQRTACAHYQSGDPNSCCEHSAKMAVKNCGAFFVYYFQNTVSCPMAYCVGDLAPCPAGTWSHDNFPPCIKAYPNMTTPPTLSDPVTDADNKCFHLQCDIHSQQHDPDQRFEVKWTFNMKEDHSIPPVIIKDPTRVTSLPGHLLKNHINSMVRCHVRAYYETKPGHKGPFLESNTYYAGIEITPDSGSGRLVVGEKDFHKDILISSTIPIMCDNKAACCLTFSLDVDATSEISVQNQCTWQLCQKDWRQNKKMATIRVPVVANQDLVDDGDKQLMLSFDKLKPAHQGQCMDIFTGHRPDPIPVETVDAKATTCTLVTDPHITTFDSVRTDMYFLGDFSVCNVSDKNFDLQVRTWACGSPGRTCICGVTIREDNDVIKIDICKQQYGGKHTSPTIDMPYGLRSSTVVQRSGDGWTVAVLLPSGTQLKVTGKPIWLNLDLKLSGRYYGQCRGICGTNDGDKQNELTYPDGKVEKYTTRKPKAFFEAWRLNQTDSLFEKLPKPIFSAAGDIKYCSCKNNPNGGPVVKCSSRGNLPHKDGFPAICVGCPFAAPLKSVCDPLNPLCHADGWNRRKRSALLRYADDDIEDYPYNFYSNVHIQDDMAHDAATVDGDLNQWPAYDGTTESEARTKCLQEMKKSALYSACETRDNIVAGTTSDCMEDILQVGSTFGLSSVKDVFTSKCQLELSQDPASLITKDGKTVLKPEYSEDICVAGCEVHGHCAAGGTCVCDQGWGGDQCHIRTDAGPQLDNIRSGPLCDLMQRPCKTIYMDATNLDNSHGLSCRIQRIDVNASQTAPVVIVKGKAVTSHRVSCEIPESIFPNQVYNISVSNDGVKFGNSLSLRVFDSSCRNCTVDGCVDKGTACQMVERTCYQCGHENGGPCSITDVLFGKPQKCPPGKNYCLNTIVQTDKARWVYRKCADREECQDKWLGQSYSNEVCVNFNPVLNPPLTCHFCCQSNDCNLEYRPADDLLMPWL